MRKLSKSFAAVAISGALASFGVVSFAPENAQAAPISELREEQKDLKEKLASAQETLDKASDEYSTILDEKQQIENRINETQQAIDSANAEIENTQKRLCTRATEMYKSNQKETFLSILLGASTLTELVDSWNMISSINQNDAAIVSKAKNLRSELSAQQFELEQSQTALKDKEAEAKSVKDAAQATADDIQKSLNSVDSEIRSQLQAEAAASRPAAAASGTSGAASGIPSNGGVLDYAYSRLGCPYVWAASGPNSFDCSGFTMWCYAQVGIRISHNSESQKYGAKAIIPVSEAEPGDILWEPGHVGLYVGGNQYIHAPTSGDVVRVASPASRFSCALRY